MSNVTEDDFETFLGRLAANLRLEELTPDENGLIALSIAREAPVYFSLDAPQNRILCFTEVCSLPSDAPADIYRRLLAAGLFGAETAGGWFALAPESDTLVYNYAADFDPASLTPEAFGETLANVTDFAALWRSRVENALADALGLPRTGDEDDGEPADEAPASDSDAFSVRPDEAFTIQP